MQCGTKVYILCIIMCHLYHLIHAGHSEDRYGSWSTEGCREVMREGNRRVCECTQLAHFGILFVSPIYRVSHMPCSSQIFIHIRT